MDITLFSYTAIMSLPWIVKGPGLLIIGIFIYRFTKHIIQFSFLSAIAALFWIWFTAYLLVKFGKNLADFIFAMI